jgi:hypothetical protein
VNENESDDLLRRALIEPGKSVAVALRVSGLSLTESLTVVFHGRRDLGTLQTYVTNGERLAGAQVTVGELLRVPCDLDLAEASDREEAERLYVEQAGVMRDALVGADTVLSIWQEPLADLVQCEVDVDRRIELEVKLPAHRLMPCALSAAEKNILVTPVCTPRSLVKGKPPVGIACSQQDFVRVYPLSDDPDQSLTDFLEAAQDYARRFEARLDHQERSVQRFLEISGEETDTFGETG